MCNSYPMTAMLTWQRLPHFFVDIKLQFWPCEKPVFCFFFQFGEGEGKSTVPMKMILWYQVARHVLASFISVDASPFYAWGIIVTARSSRRFITIHTRPMHNCYTSVFKEVSNPSTLGFCIIVIAVFKRVHNGPY